MAVVNGQLANQTTFNNAFMSRTAATTSTVAIVGLANAGSTTVSDLQLFLQQIVDAVGMSENDTDRKVYSSVVYIANGDSRKVAIGKLDAQLSSTQTQLADLDAINSQDVTLTGFGAIPNANGLTIAGQVLQLQPADGSFPGAVSTTTQTFAGAKTFSGAVVVQGNFTCTGTTTFVNSTNLDVSDKNITVNKGGNDASSEGAGLTVERVGTNGSLVYENALASKWKAGALGSESELLTAANIQLITGQKTFQGVLAYSQTVDNTSTGSNVAISATPTPIHKLTNPSLVSINNILATVSGKSLILMNGTTVSITIINNAGGTAANRILTGTGSDLTLVTDASLSLVYDENSSRWKVVGSSSSAGAVSSVALALPASVFSVTGSPVTSTGTLTGSFVNQTANTFFAGPSSGAAATPTFRALEYFDFPGRENLAINADARIVQRGTFTSATAFSALADTTKFYAVDYFGGVVTGLTSAQTTVQTLAGDLPAFANYGNSVKIAATATNASARIGSYQTFDDATYLRGKVVTLKWWVKSNNANSRIAIFDSAGTVGVSSPHTGGGGWELLTATGTISTGATTVQINARIMTAGNANVSITSGDFIQHYFPVFYEGTVFPGYVLAGGGSQAAEEMLCQYQFQKWTGGGQYFPQLAYGVNTIDFMIFTRRPMRGTPAVRLIGTANTDYVVTNQNGGGSQTGFAFATSTATIDGVTITGTKTAHTLTQAVLRLLGSTAILHLDAGA